MEAPDLLVEIDQAGRYTGDTAIPAEGFGSLVKSAGQEVLEGLKAA